MNTRFRLLFITVGAILVAAVYTFPNWLPLIMPTEAEVEAEILPGLNPAFIFQFQQLPLDQQRAYQQLPNAAQAAAMANAALSPSQSVPQAERAMPEMAGPVVVAAGEFTRLDAIRWAQGEVTIFEDPDGSKILRFERFSVVNGPELRVKLSASAEPQTIADVRLDDQDIDLGNLQGTSGEQNYEIPANLDLEPYQSIVIVSEELGVIYSIAPI